MKFTVIGITDSDKINFSEEIIGIIREGRVFSGGRRHHRLVEKFLPQGSEWIDITVPIEDVLKKYEEQDEITVFASGDPLFYGFANTLKREFPESEIKVIPTLNSLQLLAHRVLLPYADMVNVSLTGRSWEGLDVALIEGKQKIGVLTDRNKTPDCIARYLLKYDYDNYRILVGEHLGNEDERVREMTLKEASEETFSQPNCVILLRERKRRRFFGIPEGEFRHLAGRDNMITKMPVRLVSLSMLDLPGKRVMWDIGYCTGSVSIEAKLNFPHLKIFAFEKREESEAILDENTRRFGAPGIEDITGDFFDFDLTRFEKPDAVFIGVHGGRLKEMIRKVCGHLEEG